MHNTSTEKLQKCLARYGIGSRRQMETWIAEGRVTVNGAVAQIGARVCADDVIAVDGKCLTKPVIKTRVLMYHKPEGVVCTRRDPEGRPTIYEDLPPLPHGRWLYVGRLDINSAGLLLLCNDGDLVEKLLHPRYQVVREYRVRVFGHVSDECLATLLRGVHLEDGLARFETIECHGGKGINEWYQVSLREGKNREVRRLWESQGCKVSRLLRIRYGPIQLPRDLAPGQWRECSKACLQSLLSARQN
jgi:23S rRNA pseudouridine2605 synthase